jgi:L-ascorbate metabolism protein UlaG (beta-lactamase superfamily)
MRLTHLGHACLLVETTSARVLVDPGAWSSFEDVTGLDAVVVTHAHPDHVDWSRLPALVEANPDARLLMEPAVASADEARDLPAGAFASGDSVELGDLALEAVGGRHAVIHADVPRIGNVGVVVREAGGTTLFHPGDSYEATPGGVDVLAVPVNAPWAAVKETIEFSRAVGASSVVPVHDHLLSDTGRALYLRLLGSLGGPDGGEVEIRDLKGAGAVDL